MTVWLEEETCGGKKYADRRRGRIRLHESLELEARIKKQPTCSEKTGTGLKID